MEEVTTATETTQSTKVLRISDKRSQKQPATVQGYDMANFKADSTSYLGLLMIGVRTPIETLKELNDSQRNSVSTEFWNYREEENSNNYHKLYRYLLYLHRDYVRNKKQ